MKKFNWKLAYVTLTKTFFTTFFTPLAGSMIIFDAELLQSVYVGLFSSTVMCGIVFGQILDRYKRMLEENS